MGDGTVGDGTVGDGTVGDGSNPDVPVIPRPDVHVLLTADNAYGFGYGSASALTNYFMGIEDNGDDIFVCSQACGDGMPACATGACDAFGTCNADRRGPETYIVPGDQTTQDGFLYVITWSDEMVTQGLIGQFRASDGSSATVYTGSGAWQVCATGMNLDLGHPDPTITSINTQIANCNLTSSNPTYSGGWIGTALGNNPKGDMGLVTLAPPIPVPMEFADLCQRPGDTTGDAFDESARWMNFDDHVTDPPDAFHSNGGTRGDFLIFRLPISEVIIID